MAKAEAVARDPLLADLERRAQGVWVAQPRPDSKVQVLTKEQVNERESE